MEQVIFYFFVHSYYDIWPSILDTIALYREIMSIGDIISDMWMSVLFMLLGLWISWGQIRRTAYSDIGSANSVRSTLMYKDDRWAD